MSPLERLRANPLPFADHLGVDYVSAELDRIVAKMFVRPEHCTFGERVHGGALMAFADTLGGAGAFLNLREKDSGTTTIESKTNFMASAPVGAILTGVAIPIHRGRRTQVWQTRIETENGRLAALVTQTQMTL
jgi:1,4-dihydroxy-2-naphthoyl-CoA hydrolase